MHAGYSIQHPACTQYLMLESRSLHWERGVNTLRPRARDSREGSFTLMSSRHSVWRPLCLLAAMRV